MTSEMKYISWVRIPFKPEFFSGFLYATALSCVLTATIFVLCFMLLNQPMNVTCVMRVMSAMRADTSTNAFSRLLWFCITTLCDWLAKLMPFSQPMGIQTKTNRIFAARVFPRLAPVTCISFEFCLARCVVYICCDWPE